MHSASWQLKRKGRQRRPRREGTPPRSVINNFRGCTCVALFEKVRTYIAAKRDIEGSWNRGTG